jgi:hypothetical protein
LEQTNLWIKFFDPTKRKRIVQFALPPEKELCILHWASLKPWKKRLKGRTEGTKGGNLNLRSLYFLPVLTNGGEGVKKKGIEQEQTEITEGETLSIFKILSLFSLFAPVKFAVQFCYPVKIRVRSPFSPFPPVLAAVKAGEK